MKNKIGCPKCGCIESNQYVKENKLECRKCGFKWNLDNKVKKNNIFEYQEEVNDFTGLIFHCPKCNEEFHLHIANVNVTKSPLKTN